MKKFFGRFLVLLLAFAMVFSLAACGNEETDKPAPTPPEGEKPGDDDNKPNNPSEGDKGETVAVNKLIADAVNAMLEQEGFSVGGSVEYNGLVVNFNGNVATTASGYDFDFSAKAGTTTLANIVKKGEVNYSYNKEDKVWETEYAYGALPVNEITEQLAALTESLGGLPLGDAVKKDGITTVETETSYGEALEEFRTFIVDNKDVSLGDFIALTLGGEEYTRAELITDLTNIFADGNTVADAVEAIDTALSHMVALPAESPVQFTVKTLADSLTLSNGITATAVYEKLKDSLPEIEAPTSSETPYDYLMRIFGKGLLDDYLSGFDIQGSPLSCEIIRGMLEGVLSDDDTTVGTVYNMFAEAIDEYAAMIIMFVADEQIFVELAGDNPQNYKPIFCVENLEKLSFGENSVALKATFDENSLLKTLNVTLNNNIGYKATAEAQEKEFVALELALAFAFDYSAVPEIAAPATGTILPVILFENTNLDICDITGETLEIPVFAGTCEMGALEVITRTGTQIGGITYANDKITFSKDALDAVRNEIYTFGGQVLVNLPYSVNGEAAYPLGITFGCGHMRVPDFVGVYELENVGAQENVTVILNERGTAVWLEGETVKVGNYSKNDIGYYMEFMNEETPVKIDFTIESGKIVISASGEGDIEFVQIEHFAQSYYNNDDSITLFTENTMLLFENGNVSVAILIGNGDGTYTATIGDRNLSLTIDYADASILVVEDGLQKVYTANYL